MVKRVFPYQNHLQMCNRRGAQCAPAKRFDMALHRSTLCSPTIRHMPTIQNHGEFLISAFIFHSQFSIFNFYPAKENHPRFSRVVFFILPSHLRP